jgi:division protein CdvB (Snf7/Vps24/ESCRT-III family)
MAINPSTPQHSGREIEFKTLLNTSLRAFHRDFKDKEKSSEKVLANLTETGVHDRTDLDKWEPFVKADLKIYSTLQEINEMAIKANLNAQNTLKLASSALKNATDTAANTAAAAKALDKAHFSVARMTSDVASIYAKLKSEDKGSEMTILCQSAEKLTHDAAVMAEVATMTALSATIEAAQTHAQTLLDSVTAVSKNCGDLAASVAANTDAAQAQAIATYKSSLDKITTCAGDELAEINEKANNSMLSLIGGEKDFQFLYENLYAKVEHARLPKGEKEREKVEQEIIEGIIEEDSALKS